MGLEVIFDERHGVAALYDNTTNWMTGPAFSDEAEAEDFLRWFGCGRASMRAAELGIPASPIFGSTNDPRAFADAAGVNLERLVTEFTRLREAGTLELS